MRLCCPCCVKGVGENQKGCLVPCHNIYRTQTSVQQTHTRRHTPTHGRRHNGKKESLIHQSPPGGLHYWFCVCFGVCEMCPFVRHCQWIKGGGVTRVSVGGEWHIVAQCHIFFSRRFTSPSLPLSLMSLFFCIWLYFKRLYSFLTLLVSSAVALFHSGFFTPTETPHGQILFHQLEANPKKCLERTRAASKRTKSLPVKCWLYGSCFPWEEKSSLNIFLLQLQKDWFKSWKFWKYWLYFLEK